jgi:hypothetical protein
MFPQIKRIYYICSGFKNNNYENIFSSYTKREWRFSSIY